LTFRQGAECLPNHCAKRFKRINRLHGMPRGGGSSQQITHFDRTVLRIYFAVDFSEQCNGFARIAGFLLVEHDAGFVVAGARDDACDSLVVGILTGKERTIFTNDHDRPRLDGYAGTNIEMLGAIGIGELNVARDDDVSFEQSCEFSFPADSSTSGCALGFAVHAHPGLADTCDTRANGFSIDTKSTRSTFAESCNAVPAFALTNYTGAPAVFSP
jgi:hypothetical protein